MKMYWHKDFIRFGRKSRHGWIYSANELQTILSSRNASISAKSHFDKENNWLDVGVFHATIYPQPHWSSGAPTASSTHKSVAAAKRWVEREVESQTIQQNPPHDGIERIISNV